MCRKLSKFCTRYLARVDDTASASHLLATASPHSTSVTVLGADITMSTLMQLEVERLFLGAVAIAREAGDSGRLSTRGLFVHHIPI